MVTPKDIQTKQFGLSMRGYNKREVDEFLDAITIDFQAVLEEKSRLEQENKDLNARLEESQKNEHSVMNTLEQAKRLMSDISESAEKRAEVIIKNAHLDAQTITRNAKDSVLTYTEQSEQMKNKLAGFRARFKQFMNDEVGRMDSTVEELFADLGEIVPDMDELDRQNSERARQASAVSADRPSYAAPSASQEPAPAPSRPATSAGSMDETKVFSMPGDKTTASRGKGAADQTMVFGRDELKNASAGSAGSAGSVGSNSDSGSYEKYSLDDLFSDSSNSGNSGSSMDQTRVVTGGSKESVIDEFGSPNDPLNTPSANEPDTSWLKDAPDESAAKAPSPARSRRFDDKATTVVMDKNDLLREFDKH